MKIETQEDFVKALNEALGSSNGAIMFDSKDHIIEKLAINISFLNNVVKSLLPTEEQQKNLNTTFKEINVMREKIDKIQQRRKKARNEHEKTLSEL